MQTHHEAFEGVVALPVGSDSYTVATLNCRQAPTRARGDIMKSGAGASNLSCNPDHLSFSITGGTFHFPTIPADGNVYLLYYEFKI